MFKRVIAAIAAIWVASNVAWDSALKRSEEKAAENPTNPQNPSHKAGHEVTDLSSKVLLSLAVAMFMGAVFMHLGLAGGLFYLKRTLSQKTPHSADMALVSKRSPPPAPRLQSNPPAEYQNYLNNQRTLLNSYGWVDRKSKVARIPIDRAMEILSREK